MRKLFMLAVFVLGTIILANTQTLDVDWGPFNNLEKGDNVEKIVGADKDGYYTLKTTKAGALVLEYLNGATNTIESSKELLMPSVQGTQTEFLRLYFIGGQLILFTQVLDNNRKQQVCYVQYINKDGTLNNKPKEVGAVPPFKNQECFFFQLSEDQAKIFMYYYKYFTKYGGEPVTFKVFDATLTELYNKNVELPFKEREFTIEKSILGKSGDIYMMVKAVEVNAKKGKAAENAPKIYEYIVTHFNTKKDEFKTYELKLQKNIINNATITLNDKEDIVVMGFTGKKNSLEINGAFYKQINPRTFKFLEQDPKFESVLFSPEFNLEFRKERNAPKEEKVENIFKFNLNQILFLKNGTAILVAEHAYSSTQVISNPNTKQDEKYSQYFNNDIILSAADKDGKMLWTKRVPKNQFSRDDEGRYLGYGCAVEGNVVKFILNDNPKNIKENKQNGDNLKLMKGDDGQAIVLSVFQDGSFEKSPMFKDDDSKGITIVKLFIKTKDAYIAFCKKSNKYKFGKFFFQ